MGAREQGARAAMDLFVKEAEPGLVGHLLHQIYNLGRAGAHAVRSGASQHAARTSDLRGRGVGFVTRNVSAAPEDLLAGLKAFGHSGGVGSAMSVGAGGLGAYGAHELYKNEIEPRLPRDALQASHNPYAGMF